MTKDDPQTQKNLSPLMKKPHSQGGEQKTPAFGLRRPSALRDDTLSEKGSLPFGKIRTRPKEAEKTEQSEISEDTFDHWIPSPSQYSEPNHTVKLALHGETMRVNLERATRSLEENVSDTAIPILWGGNTASSQPADASLLTSKTFPSSFRFLLVIVFFSSLISASILIGMKFFLE